MMARLVDPRFLISLIVLGIFAWAFGENVTDDTMKGAIIGALNVVAGYWLGSSSGAAQHRDTQEKALALAHDAVQALPPPPKPEPDVTLQPGETAQAAEQPGPRPAEPKD